MEMERALTVVEMLVAQWQAALGDDISVLLGGSLVSGLFIAEGARAVDVDVRFLTDRRVDDPVLIARVEASTGLKYRKTITVSDWPQGQSAGVMVEGLLDAGLGLPLEVEGCIRSRAYIGWARFYREVYSPEELAEIRARKVALRDDKAAYKKYKAVIRDEAECRCLARGLVERPR